jgi:hypothetical protein
MNDELRDEYQLDYRQAKPNRFAAKLQKGGRLVVLEPEVAAAFDDSEAVNAVLKALLKTMPPKPTGPADAE